MMQAAHTSLQDELLKLQTLIQADFCGIIWLTPGGNEGGLNDQLPYFAALDYLVDGALRQLLNERVQSSGNLVMGQSFGHSFFISQYAANDEMSKIVSVLSVISEKRVADSPKVLLLGTVPLKIEEALKEKAPYLKFEILAS